MRIRHPPRLMRPVGLACSLRTSCNPSISPLGGSSSRRDAHVAPSHRRGGPGGRPCVGRAFAGVGHAEARLPAQEPVAARRAGPFAHALGLPAGHVQAQREAPWPPGRHGGLQEDLVALVPVQAGRQDLDPKVRGRAAPSFLLALLQAPACVPACARAVRSACGTSGTVGVARTMRASSHALDRCARGCSA